MKNELFTRFVPPPLRFRAVCDFHFPVCIVVTDSFIPEQNFQGAHIVSTAYLSDEEKSERPGFAEAVESWMCVHVCLCVCVSFGGPLNCGNREFMIY